MKTVLVITAYYYEGKLEEFARSYLPTPEESAIEQAQAFWAERGMRSDSNTEVHHTPRALGAMSQGETSKLLFECYPDREDLIVACARICALEAIDNGAPPIPEGQTYGEWKDQKDAFSGDYDFLEEVVGPTEYQDFFREAYLKNLFEASPCGDPEDKAKETPEEIAVKGLEDGAEAAEDLYREQGAKGLRYTQRADQLGWDEPAINAGAFRIVFGCQGTQEQQDIYYAAYGEGAEARTVELLTEEDE